MTIPVRPVRHPERRRRFDLGTTTMFFLLLAIILCLLAFLARTALGIVERRPPWAAVLVMLAAAGALKCRSGWRRRSAAKYARRAARALEEAAEKASDSLRLTAPEHAVAAAGVVAPGEPFGTAAPADPVTAPVPVPAGDAPPAQPADATVQLDPGCAERAGCAGPVSEADYAELDPDGFEQAVADLCLHHGCREAEVVGGAGDLGADVVAVAPDGRRVVIQCKQYGDTNKVGSQDMQRFGGTCFTIHEADVAAVVTTSDFTAPALEYARQCGIVCVNGDELDAWRRGTGPGPWDLADTGV
ncbi:restriction endonuclease [Streptomyces sp. SID486]|uniref:restriction endonuclease n=1 Tax=Streptomyces sp. SID486 TaxID=2690264 RepID=UPI0013688A79|nr:restriction endonuclease [Streptomyces sp. SID486]MYX99451.1 restriction endonuclease [Streptomyces sp. SID486]